MSLPPAASPRVTVIGAGVSGIAAARALVDAGVAVTVLDRGRAPGGRAASRTLAGRPVDTGASYLTARDDGFRAVVDGWLARGLAHRWTDRFSVVRPDGWSRTSEDGPVRYGTAGGMRSLVEDLAGGLDVRTGTAVSSVASAPVGCTVDGEPCDGVVVALPDPQAAAVLDPALVDERAVVEGRRWEPVLALAAGFAQRAWDVDGRFQDGCFVDDGGPLSWVADDGRRRGDGAPVLVAHSTPAFAGEHLTDADAAGPALTDALRRLLDLPAPAWTHVHRWSYARPAQPRDQPFHLGPAMVGLCGDGWGSPRFETAWCSGTLLGQELARRLLAR